VAVTPLNANGRLTIQYTSDIGHKIQALCNLPNVYTGHLVTFSGASLLTSAAASHWESTLAPMFATTTSFLTWVLERYVSGAYVEIDTGSLGGAGTDTFATSLGGQLTYTFFDTYGVKFRHRMLGNSGLTEAYKSGYVGLPTKFKQYVDDMVPAGLSGTNGDWVTGRAGLLNSRFVAIVGSFNRKTRRRLGLV
jgi:hypothetical protein